MNELIEKENIEELLNTLDKIKADSTNGSEHVAW